MEITVITIESIDEIINGIIKDSPSQKILDKYSFEYILGLKDEKEEFKQASEVLFYNTRDCSEDVLALQKFLLEAQEVSDKETENSTISAENLEDYLIPIKGDFDVDRQMEQFGKGNWENFSDYKRDWYTTFGFIIYDNYLSKDIIREFFLFSELLTPDTMGDINEEVFFHIVELIKKQGEDLDSRGKTSEDRIMDIEEVIKEKIECYETLFMPALLNSGMMIDSLYFDLKNILKDEFTSKTIASLVKKESQGYNKGLCKEYPASGLGALLTSIKTFKKLKKEKIKYIQSKSEERKKRIYMPLALTLYGHNLFRIIENGKSKQDYLLNLLIQEEFKDHLSKESFSEYSSLIKHKQDIYSLLTPAIKKIEEQVEDDAAAPMYMDLFTKPKARSMPFSNLLTEDSFLEVWINSFNKGWGDVLDENMDCIEGILGNKNKLSILSEQESGALILLLKNNSFNSYFNKKNTKDMDFDLLHQLQELNQDLFEQVYPIVGKDNVFLKSLVKLVSENGRDFSSINITNESKKFMSSLKEYDKADVDGIFDILSNFEKVQKSVSEGIASYAKRIEDLENPLGFVRWFSKNKEYVLELADHIDQIKPYLKGSKSLSLRKTLIQFAKTHDLKTYGNCLRELRKLGEVPYERVCKLLTSLKSPKTICRKREQKKPLMYMASHSEKEEWDRFAGDILRAGNNLEKRYDSILDSYKVHTRLASGSEEEVISLEEEIIEQEIQEIDLEDKEVQIFDYSVFNQYVADNGFSPEFVRTVVEDGFKLRGGGKFIGNNYIPYGNVFKTTRGKLGDTLDVQTNFSDVIKWLIKENIVLHHQKKGRNFIGGCLSVNPHISQIYSETMSDYVKQALYVEN